MLVVREWECCLGGDETSTARKLLLLRLLESAVEWLPSTSQLEAAYAPMSKRRRTRSKTPMEYACRKAGLEKTRGAVCLGRTRAGFASAAQLGTSTCFGLTLCFASYSHCKEGRSRSRNSFSFNYSINARLVYT